MHFKQETDHFSIVFQFAWLYVWAYSWSTFQDYARSNSLLKLVIMRELNYFHFSSWMNGFQIVAHHVLILPFMGGQFDVMVIKISNVFFFQNEFFVLRKYQYFSRISNPAKIKKYSLKYLISVLLHYNMQLAVVLQWNIDAWAWQFIKKN